MENINDKIAQLSTGYFNEIREIRRYLHQNPELSTEEFQTAEYVCKKLEEYGIAYKKNVGGNGIVGIIKGKMPHKKNIALRADMDALPIIEENDVDYKSRVHGKMHACGHDVHMACLLGAGRILDRLRDQFTGSVKLIFQPSEETYPGGAIRMIKEGVLKNPDTLNVVGQHVINTLESGQVGVKAGPYMASTDEVFLTVKGKGGHAATPELIIDPILIASHIIVALQQIVSRNANPTMPTVVSFGRITGDGRTNVIPDTVSIAGTVRTFDEAWRKTVHEKITFLSSSIAKAMGGNCDVKISHGYPALSNDEQLTGKIKSWAIDYLGENNVVDLETRMTAEDFSYYALEVPSCFFRLGIRDKSKGTWPNLHSTTFDVDESSLITGMGFMAYAAIRLLSE